jgi:hypothetical protein
MVPVPIALLALFYAVIATMSGVSVWKVATGVSHQSLIWPLGWFALSASAVYGLALLKSWGRTVAIIGFIALATVTLSFAALLVAGRQAGAALLTTFTAGLYVLGIRYLQRPAIKAYFVGYVVKGEG